MNIGYLIGAFVLLWLTGCSSPAPTPAERDRAPLLRLDPDHIQDAIARPEPVTSRGNPARYTVLGKTYQLLPTAQGYQEEGIASWYGSKFHGRATSLGEPYSLYGMTAAHKTLPIPCYVRVTNLDNGRQAVVRVNDRGPFHEGRIIDLSYAAAVKLGYAERGTAPVRVEVIEFDEQALSAPVYLQTGAFSSRERADQQVAQLRQWLSEPVLVEQGAGVFRVRIGPLAAEQATALEQRLRERQQGFVRLTQ